MMRLLGVKLTSQQRAYFVDEKACFSQVFLCLFNDIAVNLFAFELDVSRTTLPSSEIRPAGKIKKKTSTKRKHICIDYEWMRIAEELCDRKELHVQLNQKRCHDYNVSHHTKAMRSVVLFLICLFLLFWRKAKYANMCLACLISHGTLFYVPLRHDYRAGEKEARLDWIKVVEGKRKSENKRVTMLQSKLIL